MPTNSPPPSYNNKLFDFCEQCNCFHPAYFQNGHLVMLPCENSIAQTNYDEKITSDTNITSPNTESTNSFSSMSIKNYLSPTVKPSVTRPQKYTNLYIIQQPPLRPQPFSSKSPHYNSPSKSPSHSIPSNLISRNLQPVNHKPIPTPQPKPQLQKPISQLQKPIPELQKPFSFHNHPKPQPLLQNSPPTSSTTIKSPQYSHLPIILLPPPHHQSTDTPQFGSQSSISCNKQNTISSKRLLRQNKQFLIPKITQGRSQRSISDAMQQNDSYCCGYIKKYNK